MREQKLGAIVLAGGTSLDYFTGLRWGNSERLFAFVLPQSGSPFYVAPAFEEDRVHERMTQAARIYTWQEDDNPYTRFGTGFARSRRLHRASRNRRKMPFVFADGIAKAAPAMSIVSATPVTAGCRTIKSAAELKLMQLANDITLQVYEAAWKALQPGMTNRQFTDLINTGYQQSGFPGEASCQVDAWSALPHGSAQPQVIKEGSIVLIDDGCIVEGYQSDISRTFVVGKATDKMKRVFDVVHPRAGRRKSRSEAWRTLRSRRPRRQDGVDDAGFGPDTRTSPIASATASAWICTNGLTL